MTRGQGHAGGTGRGALTNRLYEGRPFDAATELVYHGAGRYYDPQLGQYLQPDPAGGAPLLPQTHNRYGYTGGNVAGCDVCQQGEFPLSEIVGVGKDIAFDVLGRRSIQTGVREFARLRVTASKTALSINKYVPRWVRQHYGLEVVGAGSHGRLVAESMELGIERAEAFKEYLDLALPKGYRTGLGEAEIIARRLDPLYIQLDDLPWWNIADFGLDFLLGTGFQYLEDVNNPRLTSTQVGVRAVVAGSGGAASSFVGGAIGLWVAGSICGPGAPICVAAFVVGGEFLGGIAWNQLLQSFAFELIGVTPANLNLQPLD